jgi:phosphoglycerate dehydrogenase-like enzyme
VDVPAARAAGVRVANIPSAGTGNAAACAEFALFLSLALLRDANGMRAAFAQRRLGTPTGLLLSGRAALVVGFGAIGRETTRRLAALGVRVAAVRAGGWPAPGGDAGADADAALLLERGTGPDDMRRMLVRRSCSCANTRTPLPLTLSLCLSPQGEADLVVLTCTLHAGTRGLVNASFLAAMRPGAHLVNVARGGLLDYDAVRASLEAGTLGGLGTDVAWREPWDPEDAVACHPRVVMTPHVAGVTDVSYATMARIVAEEARRHAEGRPPSEDVAVFAP